MWRLPVATEINTKSVTEFCNAVKKDPHICRLEHVVKLNNTEANAAIFDFYAQLITIGEHNVAQRNNLPVAFFI